MSAGIPPILIGVLYGFPQALQANVGILPQIGHDPFFYMLSSSLFIIILPFHSI
jgi:hypothetical protein